MTVGMKQYSVASSHPLSTRAGMMMLEKGGNAYDAALATSAALTVVQPNLNGLGGDFFAIIDDGGISAINGNGYSAEMATIDFFTKKGLSAIPAHGPLSSFSLPGLVSSWTILSRNASMPLRQLFEPAAKYAREGFRVSPLIARSIERTTETDDDWKRIYKSTADGTLIQKDLGKTLEAVAADNGHSFYHGEIARAIEKDMIAKGGLQRFSDLDSYEAAVVKPLTVRYRGYDIYTNPPSSQGVTALMWLNMLERKDLSTMGEKEYYDELLSTMKVAYSYRAEWITDPLWLTFDEKLLDPGFQYAQNGSGSQKALSHSDTTAFSVFDGKIGMSCIQSNYMGFGSGHTVSGTGINMNNRGTYFTLDGSHHNALAPRKKTFHTLMATLAKGGSTIYTSSMGGDVQPQVNVQVLSNILDRGMGIQASISHPRFGYPASIYKDSELYYEKDLQLGRGKEVDPLSSLMGHAQGIIVADAVETGFDPRGDGLLKYE